MNRRWLINRTNPEYITHLSKATSISPVLAQILINRGIKTANAIDSFLNPAITGLSDPYELLDMKIAVERIKSALSRGERVLVHGDYDTDGLTSTAIMVHALKTMGMDVHYFIPSRMTHGYGFNPPSVDMAKELGIKLIITVDCGIASLDAAAYAKKKGIAVIITDHHEPLRQSAIGSQQSEFRNQEFLLPDAIAVVNPKRGGADCRLATLSGAGVAFKVAQAFALDHDLPFTVEDSLPLLDLAALGTIADVVPLINENRIILKQGLGYIQNACRPGIKSLLEVSGLCDRDIRAGLLSYTMVPRINAAGRIGDAGDVIRLFLSDSAEETLSIADGLDRMNTERQRIEEEVYQEALSQVNAKGYDAAIVLHSKGWHVGVIGIVASRIAEEFCRPAFVFTVSDDVAKGSVRSVPGFDLCKGLSQCRDILIAFGGHKQAAGIKLYASNLSAFEESINGIVKSSL
ncbi:MAG TPA: single-stranded-DNA-specific exonuclease RecJ, partial [Nitrospiraceae bacterium]|nr:single-stranded-DNA-specific exonuclease RecJ [Nitrospiraceae bacterium]